MSQSRKPANDKKNNQIPLAIQYKKAAERLLYKLERKRRKSRTVKFNQSFLTNYIGLIKTRVALQAIVLGIQKPSLQAFKTEVENLIPRLEEKETQLAKTLEDFTKTADATKQQMIAEYNSKIDEVRNQNVEEHASIRESVTLNQDSLDNHLLKRGATLPSPVDDKDAVEVPLVKKVKKKNAQTESSAATTTTTPPASPATSSVDPDDNGVELDEINPEEIESASSSETESEGEEEEKEDNDVDDDNTEDTANNQKPKNPTPWVRTTKPRASAIRPEIRNPPAPINTSNSSTSSKTDLANLRDDFHSRVKELYRIAESAKPLEPTATEFLNDKINQLRGINESSTLRYEFTNAVNTIIDSIENYRTTIINTMPDNQIDAVKQEKLILILDEFQTAFDAAYKPLKKQKGLIPAFAISTSVPLNGRPYKDVIHDELQKIGVAATAASAAGRIMAAEETNLPTKKITEDTIRIIRIGAGPNATIVAEHIVNDKGINRGICSDVERLPDHLVPEKLLLKAIKTLAPGLNVNESQFAALLSDLRSTQTPLTKEAIANFLLAANLDWSQPNTPNVKTLAKQLFEKYERTQTQIINGLKFPSAEICKIAITQLASWLAVTGQVPHLSSSFSPAYAEAMELCAAIFGVKLNNESLDQLPEEKKPGFAAKTGLFAKTSRARIFLEHVRETPELFEPYQRTLLRQRGEQDLRVHASSSKPQSGG